MSIIACCVPDCEKPAYYKRNVLCKAHHTAQWRAKKPAAAAECAKCGTVYQKQGRGLYCSQECRVESLREHRKAERLPESEITKECSRCAKVKDRSEFGKDKRRYDRLFPYCRDCRREYVGATRQKAAELSRQEYNQRRWDKIRKDPALRNEKVLSNREAHLIRKYGMTLECYESMLSTQGGCCRICGMDATQETQTDKGGYRRAFAVDHDHACCPGSISCGKCVRGLLCAMCNTGLGAFKDNPEILAAAMQYLQSQAVGAPLIVGVKAA